MNSKSTTASTSKGQNMAKDRYDDREHSIAQSKDVGSISLEECRKVEEEFTREFKLLEKHLENPDFGVGPDTIGSELEIALVNKSNLQPSLVNLDICNNKKIDNLQPEIGKFCIEYNGPVISCDKNPLSTLENELNHAFLGINQIAEEEYNTTLVPIGILPTLTTKDLGMDALTPYWRYHSIDKLLRLLRCERDFVIDIDGEDPLRLKWYNTVLEGVNSSYQVHLRVNPSDFNDYYNASQLASAFVLAVSGNSPLLFGNRLWSETRIPVFEQAVNNHDIHPGALQEMNRVTFGRGWIKDGAVGLLREACSLFYPIFPLIPDEQKSKLTELFKKKEGPNLMHIVQHNSSIWPWNRPIYDSSDGGHFRIEMRCLPAGPTMYDLVANTGFIIGLTKSLSKNINEIISELPFKYARYNFYQAAQHGLQAKCIWRNKRTKQLEETDMISLMPNMLMLAADGLNEFGVSDLEIKNMVNCIKSRIDNRQCGASWQKQVYENLRVKFNLDNSEALKQMLKLYINNVYSSQPVSLWSKEI